MKKLLSILLCLLMAVSVLTVFTACGSTDNGGNDQNDGYDYDNDSDGKNEGVSTEPVVEKEEVAIIDEKGSALPEALAAEKISFAAYGNIMVFDGGYIYGKDEKIGIASFDGKSDTGAKYASAKGEGKYFIVAETEVKADLADLNTLNAFGLVDVTGRVIVPNQYASVSVLNERYVKVCEVLEKTDNKDEALVFMSNSSSVSIFPDNDDYYFNGTWYIYDIVTGNKVEGATGNKAVNPRVKNNIISFTNDEGKEIVINERGEALPENATVMSDGSYTFEGKVYGNDGKEMFTLKKDGYEPYNTTEDGRYYIASKMTSDGSYYAVMDKEGRLVSAEFRKSIYVYGNLIENQDKLYNFKGEQAIENEIDYVTYNNAAGIELYIIEKGEVITVLDGAFNVVYQGEMADGMRAYKSYGVIGQTVDKVDSGYCYKTGDFTVSGYPCGYLLVKGGKYPAYDLNEVITGTTLISGCRDYTVKILDGTVYAVAKNSAGYDFYVVSAK